MDSHPLTSLEKQGSAGQVRKGHSQVPAAKFNLGQLVATPGALAALEESGEEPGIFLSRHAAGDWGDLSEQDRQENEFSLAHGFRLLSSYKLRTDVKLWIITEADRSASTLLLPSEY
jgi:hypothetical protein